MNKKIVLIGVLFSILYLFPLSKPRAEYMLPYPSFMPGNKIYRISRIVDLLNTYWYFGNIAQIKYHLNLSDKYLVEAKTLMEYKQYLLATDALIRSDNECKQVPLYVKDADLEKIDTSNLKTKIVGSMDKHEEVLKNLISITPIQFVWAPEKSKATTLLIHENLEKSRTIRKQIRTDVQP
jgi:hypothetical protein